MKIGKIVITILLFGALGSCASAPETLDSSGVDITIDRLNERQVMSRYGAGTDLDPNPYLPPGGILTKRTVDYIVLRINIVSARKIMLDLNSIEAKGLDGVPVARYYDWAEFSDFLTGWAMDERAHSMSYQKASKSYLPASRVSLKPGKHSYIVVLIAERPVSLPCTVEASFYTGSTKLRTISIDIPNTK